MFVRFVVGTEAENAFWLDGVFVIAERLRNEGQLHDYEAAWLDEVFAWFNAHLPGPPFKRKLGSGEWTRDAVCWFRDDAEEPLRQIWDLVALLREHGVTVRLVTTEKPGKVVYEDEFQIVAETPYWA